MNDSAEIRLIWADRNIDYTSNSFNFRQSFPDYSDVPVLCAKTEPALTFSPGTSVEYLNFADFSIDDNLLTFRIHSGIDIELNPTDIIIIRIVEPIPIPIPANWNLNLRRDFDLCFGHLFYCDPQSELKLENVSHLVSFHNRFNLLQNFIRSTLADKNLGTYGISVGILDGPDGSFPSLFPLYKKLRSFRSVTLTINNKTLSSNGLPQIPKKLINLVSGSLEYSAIHRRILKSLFNGGIPVTLFNKEEIFMVPGTESLVRSVSFDSVDMNLEIQTSLDYAELFKNQVRCLNSMDSSDREATLRSVFWDGIIFNLMSESCSPGAFNFKLKSEWYTSMLFKSIGNRIMDMVTLIQIGDREFPILQVEVGYQNFDASHPHKDLSKMLGTMPLTCNEMAHELHKAGQRAEDARVFGIWIGGTSFQFCVAHPVITTSANGEMEIHSNLIFKDEWLFNILSDSPQETTDFATGEPTEFIARGIGEFLASLLASETAPQTDIVIQVQQQEAPPPSASQYTRPLNIRSITILHNYLKIVCARISTILNSVASDADKLRQFRPIGGYGTFAGSRSQPISETPLPHRAAESFAGSSNLGIAQVNLENLFRTTKNSLAELEIYLKLAKFPQIFPQLFDYRVKNSEDGSVVIEYEFELLNALADQYGFVSDIIDAGDDHNAIIVNSVLFGINTVYSLHTLHEVVGIIHSDISPSNVMYSKYYGTWKLNDFDHSKTVESSANLKRSAGTRNFIAPESEISGIFTKASDIYSLGQVMKDFIAPVIQFRIFRLHDLDEEIEPNPQMCQFGQRIMYLFHEMTLHDPAKRPIAVEVLLKFLAILEEFVQFSGVRLNYSNSLREARMCAELKKLKIKELEVESAFKAEPKVVDFKHSRLTIEEKDAIITRHGHLDPDWRS